MVLALYLFPALVYAQTPNPSLRGQVLTPQARQFPP